MGQDQRDETGSQGWKQARSKVERGWAGEHSRGSQEADGRQAGGCALIVAQNIVCGKRILVVDDEQPVREAIALLLSVDEHVVTEAHNGAVAFGLFAKGKFDLVLTDFEMPVMKGNALAVKIKEIAPEQPILMLTAYPERITPENPVDAIVNKPFGLDALRKAVADLLT
jgi:CheY-like chemotaxis protein